MDRLEGGLGAILDEMQRASEEFIKVIESVPQKDFVKIIDSTTTDEDCRSIQTICRHVIRSGYGYANYVLNNLNITLDFPNVNNMKIDTAEIASDEIRNMIVYNIKNLYELNREKIEKDMFTIRFTTRWNEEFNFEQILEHGIVHILRHRRQIEKFKALMKN